MISLIRNRKTTNLENVENLLQGVFEPVKPRREFIHDLNRRLSHYSILSPLVVSPSLPRISGRPFLAIFWSIFGILSGIAILLIGIRSIIVIISGLRIIYHKQV